MQIWLGAEPTFTLRSSQDPCWLWEAEGSGKDTYARKLTAALAKRFAGAVGFECVGRQYPGEAGPRFSFGLYFRRDGRALWDPPAAGPATPTAMRDAIARALPDALGFACRGEPRLAYPARAGVRVDLDDPVLQRPGCHHGPIPETGLTDPAAAAGIYVLSFATLSGAVAIELPELATPADLEALLGTIARATRSEKLPAPILRGFPPPVSAEVAWLTVTPDPGVIEVNMAPAPDLATFAAWAGHVYDAAAEAGLSAERYRYNGHATDSGGGGQITFGGPTPADSPFFRAPHLLPGLLRYVNRHPSLSYAFAMDALGSAGQGPRTDEGVRERFEELAVALDLLGEGAGGDAETLWSTLAPLLVDCAGNAHRAELNVEKLWNPHLPGRGKLGLVEFRALRMPPSAASLTAVAQLYLAIVTRLARAPYREPLIDWGPELHDRFGLPHFLDADLAAVLADLARHDLAPPAETIALARPARTPICTLELEDTTLTVTPALEFWPLYGDVASQEQRGARLVDASSARVELVARGKAAGDLAIGAFGHRIVLGEDAGVRIAGLRYRVYRPTPGLHPTLRAQDPLTITVSLGARTIELELHNWIPGGGVYDGLPADAAEARKRRDARVIARERPGAPELSPVPPALRGRFTVDLRRLGPLP